MVKPRVANEHRLFLSCFTDHLYREWPAVFCHLNDRGGLWTDGHNIFLYHHPTLPGAPILCDFGVEVTRTFETAGEVYATETQDGEAAVAVHRGRTIA